MATLKDANPMPGGVDDLVDSTVTAGSAVSGWNAWSGYTFNGPHDSFPLIHGGVEQADRVCEDCPEAGDDEGAAGGGPKGTWGVGN